ncbi:hypothetical protein [Streptomyces goshikiensis]
MNSFTKASKNWSGGTSEGVPGARAAVVTNLCSSHAAYMTATLSRLAA